MAYYRLARRGRLSLKQVAHLMKQYKHLQTGILAATLVLPVLIFLIFKLFGNNQYQLPYFGRKTLLKGDTVYYQVPIEQLRDYRNELLPIGSEVATTCYVLFQTRDQDSLSRSLMREMLRLRENLPQNNVKLINLEVLEKDDAFLKPDSSLAMHHIPIEPQSNILVQLLMQSPEEVILLDNNKHIRGVYEGNNTEEVDRLILEIRVLENIALKR